MTRDDIILMAQEANRYASNQTGDSYEWHFIRDERFAALIAAAEREACAITCEQTTAAWTQHLYNEGVMDCVKAIRARGEK